MNTINKFLLSMLIGFFALSTYNPVKAAACDGSFTSAFDAGTTTTSFSLLANPVGTATNLDIAVNQNNFTRTAGRVIFTVPGDEGQTTNGRVTITLTSNNSEFDSQGYLMSFTVGPLSNGSSTAVTDCAERLVGVLTLEPSSLTVPTEVALASGGNTASNFNLRNAALGGPAVAVFNNTFVGEFISGRSYEATCSFIKERDFSPVENVTCTVNLEFGGDGNSNGGNNGGGNNGGGDNAGGGNNGGGNQATGKAVYFAEPDVIVVDASGSSTVTQPVGLTSAQGALGGQFVAGNLPVGRHKFRISQARRGPRFAVTVIGTKPPRRTVFAERRGTLAYRRSGAGKLRKRANGRVTVPDPNTQVPQAIDIGLTNAGQRFIDQELSPGEFIVVDSKIKRRSRRVKSGSTRTFITNSNNFYQGGRIVLEVADPSQELTSLLNVNGVILGTIPDNDYFLDVFSQATLAFDAGVFRKGRRRNIDITQPPVDVAVTDNLISVVGNTALDTGTISFSLNDFGRSILNQMRKKDELIITLAIEDTTVAGAGPQFDDGFAEIVIRRI